MQKAMRTGQRLVVRGLVVLVMAVFCTLGSGGAQVQLPTVSNPFSRIDSIAITPDGQRLLFSGTDIEGVSGMWLKDVRTGAVARFETDSDFGGGAFSPDGQWLVFRSERQSALRRVRVSG